MDAPDKPDFSRCSRGGKPGVLLPLRHGQATPWVNKMTSSKTG